MDYITCSLISHNPKETHHLQVDFQTFRTRWSPCCWPPPLSSFTVPWAQLNFLLFPQTSLFCLIFIYFQDTSFVSLQKNQLLVIFYAYLSLHSVNTHAHHSTLFCFPLCYWSPPHQLVTIFFDVTYFSLF